MGQHPFTPYERIAGIVARAVEQLAEVHVEVAQEGIEPIGVRKRNAQIATVLTGPDLETIYLRIAQTRTQRLAGLQVFMRHGAQRSDTVTHRHPDIAGS